jgi:hypothetical protein
MKNLSRLKQVESIAHAAGDVATRVYGTAVYGTRHLRPRNAGDAPHRRAADGIGIHSVYEGPLKIAGGAPILKRNQSF